MTDEYISKQDAFDAVEARIAELMTHPEFRRKHLDIDLSGVIRNISAIEPANVVPVVHGRWVKEDRGHVEYCAVCDQCGFDWMWSDRGYFKFCPNCGAKMDGKKRK